MATDCKAKSQNLRKRSFTQAGIACNCLLNTPILSAVFFLLVAAFSSMNSGKQSPCLALAGIAVVQLALSGVPGAAKLME